MWARKWSVNWVMQDIERTQLKGNASEEELRALEIDKTNKSMLTSWRATRFEIMRILRKVRPLSLSIIRFTTYTHHAHRSLTES